VEMPTLASELLAVIGGTYLMREKLDEMSQPPAALQGGGTREQSPMSFAKIATRLAIDLSTRARRPWGQVLIVGEERLGDDRLGYLESEIIRLRFPACDLWNLPFTAHEYGFLVANFWPPKSFTDLKDRVTKLVDPDQHPGGEAPDESECFLPEVRRFWERRDEQRLSSLTKRQEFVLCRLFADAFATHFVGPAYVHALLHLRFIPNRTLYESSGTTPAFADRFVFALETLKWMDKQRGLYERFQQDQNEGAPFSREVAEGSGILPLRWSLAVTSAGLKNDHYKQIASRYKSWLEQVWAALSEEWRGPLAGVTTYKHWQEARKLEDKLTKIGLKVPRRPADWAVLNAAWSARLQREGDVQVIEANALALLDLDNDDMIDREETPARPTVPPWVATGPTDEARLENDDQTVQKFLQVQPDLLLTYLSNRGPDGSSKIDVSVIAFVKADPTVYAAYMRLCGLGS
jgi:hypothetical protein